MSGKEKSQNMTKYERARLLGARALQISMGAPFMVKLDDAELKKIKYNPLEIARKEMAAGVLPLAVKRPEPVGKR